MGQIETVVLLTREIESLLDKAGASGRGLHDKVTSIESQLDNSTIKRLRWIATMRNKTLHEDGFSIDDMDGFEEACSIVIDELESESGNGCFIATAVYGSYDCAEVLALRRFRDSKMMNNMLGRSIVAIYYKIGPLIAEKIKQDGIISKTLRILLDKMIRRVT